MKRFVVLVMMVMSIASVSAQRWSLTPEVGVTGVLRKENMLNTYEQKWGVRWKMGVGVEYQTSSVFSLKSGLYYTQRGYSSHLLMPGNEETGGMYDVFFKLNRHFLQVPLLANVSFKVADEVRLNVGVGPYVAWSVQDNPESSYLLWETTEGGESIGVDGSSGIDAWKHDRAFDWGASLQAGVEVKQWVMNVGYDISLGKEYDKGLVCLKYHTLNFTVGYKFRLGK